MTVKEQLTRTGAGRTYVSAAWIIEEGDADNRQGIYRKMETEGFPKPVRLGPRTVRWIRDEIIEWRRSRPRIEYASERRKCSDTAAS